MSISNVQRVRAIRRALAIAVLVACCYFAQDATAVVDPVLKAPHSIIRQGRIAGYRWWVLTHRGHDQPTRQPCIDVSIGHKPTRLAYDPINTICGAVNPVPTVVGASAGPANAERTVLALVFSLSARHVELNLGARGRRILTLTKLRRGQARRAHVDPFRFAVLSLVGPFCVYRIKAFGLNDTLITDSGLIGCK